MVQTVWPYDPNCTTKPIKRQDEEKSHLATKKNNNILLPATQ